MRCIILWFCQIFYVLGSLGLNPDVADVRGRACVFGDFNADRNTDILVSRDGNLTILLQMLKPLEVLEPTKFVNSTTWQIADEDPGDKIECSVGDFDGDARLDVLVSIRLDENKYNHTLYLSRVDDRGVERFEGKPIETLAEHAMAIDVNSDGFNDILGFYPNGTLFCTSYQGMYLADCTNSFNSFPMTTKIYDGMPHLFVDINSDLRSDIVFMTKDDDGSLVMQVWQQQKIGWVEKKWISKLSSAQYAYIAAPVTMDFDGDGVMDLLVPVCREPSCQHVTSMAAYSYQRGWTNVAIDLQDLEVISEPYSRVLFRAGDYSLSGFPDMIALLQQGKTKSPRIIENIECKNCEKNGTRKFEVNKAEFVQSKNLSLGIAKMVTFFDLLEDGKLDLLVEYEYAKQTRVGFIACPDKGDTTFLKVQVFTGVCARDCKDRSKDLGPGSVISMAGACASFSMSDGWGGSSQSVQCQVPSSSHRSLFLPFLVFGLGRSPNFVDELNMGIPKYKDMKSQWYNSLKQIVPNSRIMVQPTESGHWLSRLYVTPSQLIVQSILVIASVCAMLLMVALFLHYREKKEDRYERQQQSHQFHFDAM